MCLGSTQPASLWAQPCCCPTELGKCGFDRYGELNIELIWTNMESWNQCVQLRTCVLCQWFKTYPPLFGGLENKANQIVSQTLKDMTTCVVPWDWWNKADVFTGVDAMAQGSGSCPERRRLWLLSIFDDCSLFVPDYFNWSLNETSHPQG